MIYSIAQAAELVDLSIQSLYCYNNPFSLDVGAIDEYTNYNRRREEAYDAEDRAFRMKMRILYTLLGVCLAALIVHP